MDIKKSEKSTGWIAAPATVILPSIPILANDVIENTNNGKQRAQLEPLMIKGVQTVPCNINEAIQKAKNELNGLRKILGIKNFGNYTKTFEKFTRQQKVNKMNILYEFVEKNPFYLQYVPWISEILLRNAKHIKRPKGRPARRYRTMHPLILVALVNHLINTNAVRTTDKAFRLIHALGVRSYTSAKTCYFSTLSDEQYKPVCVVNSENEYVPTIEEIDRLHSAQRLGIVKQISQEFDSEEFGKITITFTATEEPS